MIGYLSAYVSDMVASLALVVGAANLTATLVLVGATTLAAVGLMLVSRAAVAVVPGGAPCRVTRPRGTPEVVPLASQRDPDAAGRVRPRAPGAVLG